MGSVVRNSVKLNMAEVVNPDVILQVEDLCKSYNSVGRTITVLEKVNIVVKAGSTSAIVGPSGSGKTTLLGLCAGLDAPSSGKVVLNNISLNELNEDGRAELRNQSVGFVFQTFQLLPTLTAIENIMVPLELRGESDIGGRAGELLERVGLAERANHYPVQLSGGEQQRVALARAFINQPRILFVDEPTGNLDAETSEHVADLLFELNRVEGTTLVLVTHNPSLASRTERILRLQNGKLIENRKEAKPDD